jgi:hypothetical protein
MASCVVLVADLKLVSAAKFKYLRGGVVYAVAAATRGRLILSASPLIVQIGGIYSCRRDLLRRECYSEDSLDNSQAPEQMC